MELVYSQSPITALAFYKSKNKRIYLLSGEDVWLRVYDVTVHKLCGGFRVFASQAIHGIVTASANGALSTASGSVVLWGGQSISALSQDAVEDLLDGANPDTAPTEATAPDWILDGALCPGDERLAVVITAHNEAVPVHLDGELGPVVFGPLFSPARPLLFSASAVWTAVDTVLVAAGTAFGEIILWKCQFRSGHEQASCTVLSILTGHEGSVFGVSISPDIILPSGRKSRLLASCSDDRTIRVWDAAEGESHAPADASRQESLLEDARETGFANGALVGSSSLVRNCIASAMCHLSRIWRVAFAPAPEDESSHQPLFDIYSFGEDATTQQWRLHIEQSPPRSTLRSPGRLSDADGIEQDKLCVTLTHCRTISPHTGRNIWAAAIWQPQGAWPVIATGGADQKIALQGNTVQLAPSRALKESESKQTGDSVLGNWSISFSMSDIQEKLLGQRPSGDPSTDDQQGLLDGADKTEPLLKLSPKSRNSRTNENIQRYTFLRPNQLLAVSTFGRLLLGSLGSQVLWTELDVPVAARDDLRSYSALGGNNAGVVLIGSSSGTLYIYSDRTGFAQKAKLPRKIVDIFCLNTHFASTAELSVTETQNQGLSAGPETADFLITVLDSLMARVTSIHVPNGGQKIPHSAVKLDDGTAIPTAASYCGSFIVVGSRTGWISIHANAWPEIKKAATIRANPTKDAITCILALEDGSDNPPSRFLTTSRDGIYRIFRIAPQSDGHVALQLEHEMTAAFGPQIEGAWYVRSAEDDVDEGLELVLCGFQGTEFMVWNETRRQSIASVWCGGAHRTFAYMPMPGNSRTGFCFTYTKQRVMTIHSQMRAEGGRLMDGGHGRDVRAVACSGEYIATGAEDTTIRISRLLGSEDGSYYRRPRRPSRQLECLAVLNRHNAGITALKWHGPNYLLSSGGNEELFVWRVSRLDSKLRGLYILCEAKCPSLTEASDVRITDFDVGANQESGGLFISLATSDSTFRTYSYSQRDGFRLITRGSYTGACLTRIRLLHCQPSHSQVATTATDGQFAIWTAGKDSADPCTVSAADTLALDYTPDFITKLHQDSIKAFDMVRILGDEEDHWIAVTGGDDNALGILCLTLGSSTGRFTVLGRYMVESAHAASITALGIVRQTPSLLTVTTASNDQTVALWRIHHRAGLVQKVSVLKKMYSTVADPGDLEVVQSKVIVAGVGLEVWSLELHSAFT